MGQLLAAVTSAKYLGVTITDKVNWSQHIDSITNNANRTLGFLRRYLKISSLSIKEQAYNSLVRPLVEYASPVWDPHHQTDIRKMECTKSMCWLQFTLSVMVTPRYLADVTAASNCPRMVYSVTMGFRLMVTVRTVHLLDGTVCTSLLPIV
jgi:hypothetical protein